jgi:hypothetical protein
MQAVRPSYRLRGAGAPTAGVVSRKGSHQPQREMTAMVGDELRRWRVAGVRPRPMGGPGNAQVADNRQGKRQRDQQQTTNSKPRDDPSNNPLPLLS